MRFGAVIVGDEILLGKRTDRHIPFLINALNQRGHELAWAQFVSDDALRLERVLRSSMAEVVPGELAVISFGGIGATPDDRTRQCAALAAGLPLEYQPEGVKILEQEFADRLYPHRINMVNFPAGSELIPNPVNRVPGFSINQHHFVPGFPSMAHPMIEWVLDTLYTGGIADAEQRRIIENTAESDLIPIMEKLLAGYPNLKLSCLPSAKPGVREIDLGLRATAVVVEAAGAELDVWLSAARIPQRPFR